MNETDKNSKVAKIRDITMSPFKKISEALETCNGDVDKTIALLISNRQADSADIANRVASASIVQSYVHNNKVGAMIVLACQTDFVAKNETFLSLAKDICIHITSAPTVPLYITETDIPKEALDAKKFEFAATCIGKPEAIVNKIVMGKLQKFYSENCLLNQKFVKNEDITIAQLIKDVSATVGEKIELKKFIKITTAQ